MNFPTTDEEFFNLRNDDNKFFEFLLHHKLIEDTRGCCNDICAEKPYNVRYCLINNEPKWRCYNDGCKYSWSIRNNIFNLSSNSNLSLTKIIGIFWYWSLKRSVQETADQLDLSKSTVVHWFCKIRTILQYQQQQAEPMGGPGYSVQIDESLFQGRRKYNRGRLLQGNHKPQESEPIVPDGTTITETNRSKRNYGNRVVGPWVFGLVCQKISDIEQAKTIETNKTKIIKQTVRSKFECKNARKKIYRDKRKLNLKQFRNYTSKTQ